MRYGRRDHQAVLINFEDGATATHTMVGGASSPDGRFTWSVRRERSRGSWRVAGFVVRHPDHARTPRVFYQSVVDLAALEITGLQQAICAW